MFGSAMYLDQGLRNLSEQTSFRIYSLYGNQEGFLWSDFPHKKIKYFLFTILVVFNTEKNL